MCISLPFSIYKVEGDSMLPNFSEGTKILVRQWFINPRVNDVVIVSKNGRHLIKRVTKIQNNKFFVAGDNRAESADSRKFGGVKREEIMGKIMRKF